MSTRGSSSARSPRSAGPTSERLFEAKGGPKSSVRGQRAQRGGDADHDQHAAAEFAVQVLSGDEVIGMGRIIGDGGSFYQVADIAVLPARSRPGRPE